MCTSDHLSLISDRSDAISAALARQGLVYVSKKQRLTSGSHAVGRALLELFFNSGRRDVHVRPPVSDLRPISHNLGGHGQAGSRICEQQATSDVGQPCCRNGWRAGQTHNTRMHREPGRVTRSACPAPRPPFSSFFFFTVKLLADPLS